MNEERKPPRNILESAHLHPNEWMYELDGDFAPGEAVPPDAIIGAWSVDYRGRIVGGFIPNPTYSESAFMFPGGGA